MQRCSLNRCLWRCHSGSISFCTYIIGADNCTYSLHGKPFCNTVSLDAKIILEPQSFRGPDGYKPTVPHRLIRKFAHTRSKSTLGGGKDDGRRDNWAVKIDAQNMNKTVKVRNRIENNITIIWEMRTNEESKETANENIIGLQISNGLWRINVEREWLGVEGRIEMVRSNGAVPASA